MFDFCPHCGQSVEQDQQPGQTILCRHCRQLIGVVKTLEPVIVDRSAELIGQGVAARCPECGELVEIKTVAGVRTLTRHGAKSGDRKLCPGGGKAVAESESTGGSHRPARLEAAMTRETIRAVCCRRGVEPQIEELTFEYLDKSDRVRVQIEGFRELLGPDFRMRDYPAALNRPQFAVWGNATACIIGKRHERGGCQSMMDAEIAAVVEEVRKHALLFLG
jgi:hypothetical protein